MICVFTGFFYSITMTEKQRNIIEFILLKFGLEVDRYKIEEDKRIWVKGETKIEMAIEIHRVKKVDSIRSVWSDTPNYRQGYRTYIEFR